MEEKAGEEERRGFPEFKATNYFVNRNLKDNIYRMYVILMDNAYHVYVMAKVKIPKIITVYFFFLNTQPNRSKS